MTGLKDSSTTLSSTNKMIIFTAKYRHDNQIDLQFYQEQDLSI